MFRAGGKASSLSIAICVLLTGCTHGPGPEDTIRNAYAWYLRTIKSGVDPLEQRTELKEFVTEGFLVSLDNMRPALDASPFVEARSFDAKLSIQKVVKNNRAATVRIELSGRFSGQHTLNVYLVKVDDRWKVDDVKMVEESSAAAVSRNGCFQTADLTNATVKSPDSLYSCLERLEIALVLVGS
jgi:Protein of unknown function (DUF3828)